MNLQSSTWIFEHVVVIAIPSKADPQFLAFSLFWLQRAAFFLVMHRRNSSKSGFCCKYTNWGRRRGTQKHVDALPTGGRRCYLFILLLSRHTSDKSHCSEAYTWESVCRVAIQAQHAKKRWWDLFCLPSNQRKLAVVIIETVLFSLSYVFLLRSVFSGLIPGEMCVKCCPRCTVLGEREWGRGGWNIFVCSSESECNRSGRCCFRHCLMPACLEAPRSGQHLALTWMGQLCAHWHRKQRSMWPLCHWQEQDYCPQKGNPSGQGSFHPFRLANASGIKAFDLLRPSTS